MKTLFVRLQSDHESVLLELFTELPAKILMNVSLPSNFESLLHDISNRYLYLALLLGDCNARDAKWRCHDTTTKSTQI